MLLDNPNQMGIYPNTSQNGQLEFYQWLQTLKQIYDW